MEQPRDNVTAMRLCSSGQIPGDKRCKDSLEDLHDVKLHSCIEDSPTAVLSRRISTRNITYKYKWNGPLYSGWDNKLSAKTFIKGHRTEDDGSGRSVCRVWTTRRT